MDENQPTTAKRPMNKTEIVTAFGETTGLSNSSPGSTNVSAEDRQTDMDENTNMISEGGPVG
jgi:hypothetical protein